MAKQRELTNPHPVADIDIISKFDVLIEESLAGVYIIQGRRLRYVNPAFAQVFGYQDPSDLIDRIDIYDLIADKDHEQVAANMQRRIAGVEDGLRYSFTGLRKDGSEVEVEVHGRIMDLNGDPAIFGMLLDITDSKRQQKALLDREKELEDRVEERTQDLKQALRVLKSSEERYRVLFDGSRIPMLLIDPKSGAIVDANTAACDYYGYSLDQLTAKPIFQINQLSDAEIAAEMADAKANNRNHFFFVHQLADGRLRDVEVHSGPLEIDGKKLLYSIIHDVTERREAEDQLNELNRDFVTLLESTSDFIYYKDKESRFRFCSQTLAQITGHQSWRDMVGKHDLEVFPPDTAKIYYEEEFPIFEKGEALLNKVDPYYDESGNRGWVATNKWPVVDEHTQEVTGLFGISRDITAQHDAEEKLKVAASVFENASEGILITDADGKVVEVNQAFCRMSGYSREEVLNRNPKFLKSGHHDSSFFQGMWEALARTGYWQGEIWNRRKDGSLFACRTSINALLGPDGNIDRYIGLHSDITDFLRHHEEIERMAYYDTLTRLPNRALLFDRLNQAMAMADRSGKTVAVCFLDLDMFKPVNDRFGHKAGDQLLVEVAKRLQSFVRIEDTVARFGGDEFTILFTHLSSEDDLVLLLDRIIKGISQPFQVDEKERVQVSASIGISLYPQNKVSAEQLLKQADQAMYDAKELGRNQYRIRDAF